MSPHRPPRTLRRAFVVTATAAALASPVGCQNDVQVFTATGSGGNGGNDAACPASDPGEGTACSDEGLSCTYGEGCTSSAYRCQGGTWQSEATPGCPGCPASVPAEGEACFVDGMECGYGGDACGFPEQSAICDEGAWTVWYNSCNPPPPFQCPPELPLDGSDCTDAGWGEPGSCSYEVETSEGPQTATAECDYVEAGLLWTVTFPDGGPASCASLEARAHCLASDACRWLVPGCGGGTETVTPEGCYPATDCTPGSCLDDQACVTTVHDPCAFSTCGTCGAEAAVCLAP